MSIRCSVAGFTLAALIFVTGFGSSAEAGVFAKNAAKVSAQPPRVVNAPEVVTVLKGEPVEELIGPGIRGPNIVYRNHGPQRLKQCGTVTVHLSVNDPCKGCVYDVPVCLPECCIEAPRVVVEKAGAHGRSVGVYVWCCGYKVKIIHDGCGNIGVHTIGR